MGEKMENKIFENKNYVLLGMVALVLIVSIIQSFQINSLKSNVKVGISQSGGIDMSGWTADEKMMYEHHGTLPARVQGGAQSSPSGGMVGGC